MRFKANSHGAIFLFVFPIRKMDCVDLNDTVHMVRFALHAMQGCVCDVTRKWFHTYSVRLQSVIPVNAMCIPIHIHSKLHSCPITPCEQNTINPTENIFKKRCHI